MSAEAVSPSTALPGSGVTAALRDGALRRWLGAHADAVLAVLLLTWGVAESLTLAAGMDRWRRTCSSCSLRRRWYWCVDAGRCPFAATTLSLALISTIWLTNTERENWTIYASEARPRRPRFGQMSVTSDIIPVEAPRWQAVLAGPAPAQPSRRHPGWTSHDGPGCIGQSESSTSDRGPAA